MKLLVTDDPDEMEQADQVLLYLNRATWANDDEGRSDALTEEIHALLQPSFSLQGREPSRVSRVALGGGAVGSTSGPQQPLLLVHEVDEQRGGVAEFGYFFAAGVTPPELLKLGIYAEIAIPMKAGEYRSVSRGLLDHALRVEQSGSAAPCLSRLAAFCHLPPWAQRRLRLSNRGAPTPVVGPLPPPRDIQVETGEDQCTSVYWRVYRHVLFSARRHAGARGRSENPTRTRLCYHRLTVRGADCSESKHESVRV